MTGTTKANGHDNAHPALAVHTKQQLRYLNLAAGSRLADSLICAQCTQCIQHLGQVQCESSAGRSSAASVLHHLKQQSGGHCIKTQLTKEPEETWYQFFALLRVSSLQKPKWFLTISFLFRSLQHVSHSIVGQATCVRG